MHNCYAPLQRVGLSRCDAHDEVCPFHRLRLTLLMVIDEGSWRMDRVVVRWILSVKGRASLTVGVRILTWARQTAGPLKNALGKIHI